MSAQVFQSQERFCHDMDKNVLLLYGHSPITGRKHMHCQMLDQRGMKATRTPMCLPGPAHLSWFLCKTKGSRLGYIYLLWQDNRRACGKEEKYSINMYTQAWVALTFQVKSQYSCRICCYWYWCVFMQSNITGNQRYLCTNLWKQYT